MKEENIVHSQLHGMKERTGMSFWPTPIMHPTKLPTNDIEARAFIIIKPCGYCNQCFHCHDIAIISCKHVFHPFCLDAMLKDSNKCYMCKQKFHPNWLSSWGICETLPKEFVNKLLKQIKATKPSNAIETKADVEDAETPPVKKHSKPPKATQNANTLKIGAILRTQSNLILKGGGTKSSSKL